MKTNSHNNGFSPVGVILCTFLAFSAMVCAGTYSGGSGTADNPYKISTKTDLLALAATPADYGKSFILTADIDLNGQIFTSALIAPDSSSSSDYDGIAFTGNFDGNGHKIVNWTINGGYNDYLGLFGQIGTIQTSGLVKNLGVDSFSITSRSYKVGGLCGAIYLDSTISHCYANGTIENSGYYVGALCGYNQSGTIVQSYGSGTVYGWYEVGGLCGYNQSGTIGQSFAIGKVDGWQDAGGLCGGNSGPILQSFATGAVTGMRTIGGLCGHNWYGSITESYSTGHVKGYDTEIGGLCGYNYLDSSITRSFWDIETSGQLISAGGIGKTTVEMKDLPTFLNEGWDFVNIWWLPTNDYPQLMWRGGYSGGYGTSVDPYRVSKIADWQKLIASSSDWDKSFILVSDIDFSGVNLTPVAPDNDSTDYPLLYFQGTPFSGEIDGRGHVLRNVVIQRPNQDYVGLFGCYSPSAKVDNLTLDNVTIRGRYFVGGLVGRNVSGTIISCKISGSIMGTEAVGGVVGGNEGIVQSCQTIGTLIGEGVVGGITGRGCPTFR
ncbi:MAG: hypothetical protein GX455_09050 [Phycisphaerae bacterium]|nr:hypothetical protein [Phycisphaerae bacterium]